MFCLNWKLSTMNQLSFFSWFGLVSITATFARNNYHYNNCYHLMNIFCKLNGNRKFSKNVIFRFIRKWFQCNSVIFKMIPAIILLFYVKQYFIDIILIGKLFYFKSLYWSFHRQFLIYLLLSVLSHFNLKI